MKLKNIGIKRFRSINDIKLEIDTDTNFISICGANNVGKTNVLRAINLFFNPKSYSFDNDAPYLKQNTRGGSVDTEVTLQFEEDDKIYEIIRTIRQPKENDNNYDEDGIVYPEGVGKGKSKKILTKEEVKKIVDKFVFFFIPAINISFPDLINLMINNVYDLEFSKSRFSGLKKELKESFEKYNEGLLNVLNTLAEDIKPLFQTFNEHWSVEFKSNATVNKFQDLISEDIRFYIHDEAGFNNENKGSGLQKLGFILLHQKIIENYQKLKK
ncbi:MAG: AAA family ATPase [Cardiobacteriaceae bacterium]|nr:AAA family ATPase [Cardiobacteriaceae bacterium]